MENTAMTRRKITSRPVQRGSWISGSPACTGSRLRTGSLGDVMASAAFFSASACAPVGAGGLVRALTGGLAGAGAFGLAAAGRGAGGRGGVG